MKPLDVGDCLDHYCLENLVARGGMACVFRATDLRTGRQVAIKVPHLEAECDVVFFERFRREAAIGREMDHPGIVKVINEEKPGQVYTVMEWVEGRLLREVLAQEGRLPTARATRIAVGICHALRYIHSHGVVHRDLKPENVMLDAEDGVKLIDFGIASKAGSRRMTFGKLSNIMGTPEYISPEQVKGARGDASSDLYALGVMFYEMLTGQTPFHGSNPFAVMNARLKTTPVPPGRLVPDLPPQLDAILSRALERDARHRYRSAAQFADDLEHPDQAGGSERSARGSEQSRRRLFPNGALFYGALAMLPVTIFALMLFVARIT